MNLKTCHQNADPVVVYLCDQRRIHQVGVSIFSWQRFRALDIFVIDYGLSCAARNWLIQSCGVRVLALASHVSLDFLGADARRIGAYREKARIGLQPEFESLGDRTLIFLDADIVVTHPSFFNIVDSFDCSSFVASPSAWDRDFTWTYEAKALTLLREVSRVPTFGMNMPIPNSGVTASTTTMWRRVSAVWAEMYDAFLKRSGSQNVVRAGRLPGDQEFLSLALQWCKVPWVRLHGSCNMQVDPMRMRWVQNSRLHPLGGHLDEEPQPVRAVHYGCEPNGEITLGCGMLGSFTSRKWLREEVRTAWVAAHKAGISCCV